MPSGRKDRQQRLTESRSGSVGSSSQDYVALATQLFAHSAAEAQGSGNGNRSTYTLAGIPVLFSAFRALLIEGNFGMFGTGRRPDVLTELGNGINECVVFGKHYDVTSDLENSLRTLAEVRNEIVHPTHLPGTRPGQGFALLSPAGDCSPAVGKATMRRHHSASGRAPTSFCRTGPLVFYVEDFAASLIGEGYAPYTLKTKYQLAGDLSAWLARRGLPLAELDAKHLRQFYAQRHGGCRRGDARSEQQLLEFLRARDAIPPPTANSKPNAYPSVR